MQNSIALPANKTYSLADLKQWAFPHWILWFTVLALFALNSLWLGLSTRISIEPTWITGNAILTVAAFAIITFRAMKPEKFDWFLHRLWCTLLCVLVCALLMRNIQVCSHLVLTTNLPLQDDLLLTWDRALGFEWDSYVDAMTTVPFIQSILFFAYNELTFAGLAFVALIIVVLNQRVRSIEIIYLVVATALACILISIFFPAKDALVTLNHQDLLARLNIGDGAQHVRQFLDLRGTGQIHMTPDTMQGLITFPSFHTCMALIIAWCSRGRWYTTTPGTIIGAAIIAATPIFGGHYLVDVIGGTAVTAGAIWIWSVKIKPHVLNHMADTHTNSFPLPKLLIRLLKII